MENLLVMPKSIDFDYIEEIDGVIVGLKDYAVAVKLELSVTEILKLKERIGAKKLFVVINKNLFNKEIPYIEEVLEKLENKVEGVFFYDLAILSICQRKKLSLPLVWNQTHMVTNYNTCNYYYKEGVKYASLSLEITALEMKEIKEQSSIEPIVYVFGRNTVAHSKRKLLTNYFKHYKKEKENSTYKIKERVSQSDYDVYEDKNGTTIVRDEILNGVQALYDLKKAGISYFILDEVVDRESFKEIIACYRQCLLDKDEKDKEKNVKRVEEITGSNYEGFFYKKTVYKVKKNG